MMGHIPVRIVVAHAAAHTGVSASDILGPSQIKPIAHARHLAVWLATRNAGLTQADLGLEFSRHRKTLVASTRKIDSRRARYEGFAQECEALELTLRCRVFAREST